MACSLPRQRACTHTSPWPQTQVLTSLRGSGRRVRATRPAAGLVRLKGELTAPLPSGYATYRAAVRQFARVKGSVREMSWTTCGPVCLRARVTGWSTPLAGVAHLTVTGISLESWLDSRPRLASACDDAMSVVLRLPYQHPRQDRVSLMPRPDQQLVELASLVGLASLVDLLAGESYRFDLERVCEALSVLNRSL
jgi:hypothetical protein